MTMTAQQLDAAKTHILAAVQALADELAPRPDALGCRFVPLTAVRARVAETVPAWQFDTAACALFDGYTLSGRWNPADPAGQPLADALAFDNAAVLWRGTSRHEVSADRPHLPSS